MPNPTISVSRADCYFGLHFDLHPGARDTVLGADVSAENIDRLLARVKPDAVQYDCKGHAGYTGYPTQIGWPSPGIVKDSLAVWREVTRRHGVSLGIHYSGVWDYVAVEKHPEWAAVGPDGKPDKKAASTFGPYVDQLMIPELKEVIERYAIDSLWVDGDCWGAALDYSPAALAAWKRQTGRDDAPRKREDPGWLEWKNFHRAQYERYLCHWVDALHAFRPGLVITSNWMYTTFAPKPVVARLDHLSGDFSPSNSVDYARIEGRYIAGTGMPWDLMSWGFTTAEGLDHGFKTPAHLQQEAAAVISQGGGYMIYYPPTRSGHVSDLIIETAGQVADFCRARQAVSHHSTSVPQVALLYSSESLWDASDTVFGPAHQLQFDLEGALTALLESHYSVDILAEHTLQPRLRDYPLVVVPNAYKMTDGFRAALVDYVRQGGNLLLLGGQGARLFESELGARINPAESATANQLITPAGPVNANGKWLEIESAGPARPLAERVPGLNVLSVDDRTNGISEQYQQVFHKRTAATETALGKGRIIAVYGPVGEIYFRGHHPFLRQWIGGLAARLFPDPALRIDAPPVVEAALRRTPDGRLAVHLLNTAGMPVGGRHPYTDFIPPVGPIHVRLTLPARPGKVEWVPAAEDAGLRWKWSRGVLDVTIPRLAIHGVVVVNE
ncbi:MAG: alpha-L-fucosidase [bacterium]|nr:alpha-L-fucosidase [bacterium]